LRSRPLHTRCYTSERQRILIVHDNVDDYEMYQQFLKARGYVVSVASDGEDAVYRALNGTFDLVVLDIGLRRTDGIGAPAIPPNNPDGCPRRGASRRSTDSARLSSLALCSLLRLWRAKTRLSENS
jgi:hypothetical protein